MEVVQPPAPIFLSVFVDMRDVDELNIKVPKEDLPNGYEPVASGAPTTGTTVLDEVAAAVEDVGGLDEPPAGATEGQLSACSLLDMLCT